MPCYHPIDGYMGRSLTKNGKRPIVFTNKAGFADKPVKIPCGQCIGCRLERSRQWAVRCVHEADLHEDNCFITLTYDNEHLPFNGTLVKDDFQRFMKRFRKAVAPREIRFFHCGEYGETTQRPHYHAIIFGYDFPDKVLFKTVNGVRVYTSEMLSKLWGNGFITIGDVTFESAAYVARYVLKKITGEQADSHYNGRLPEYVTMSRRPGIAHSWIENNVTDVYPSDEVIIRGHQCKPPKYYDRVIAAKLPYTIETIKRARKVMSALHADDSTYERLQAKEFIKMRQVDMLPRNAI